MQRKYIYGWFVWGLAVLFYCYEYLLRISPNIMVPELMQTYKITASGFGIYTAMYFYAYTPMQIVVGPMMDYFGAKRILTLAIGFCVIGSLLLTMANSFYFAILARFLIGIGSSFAFIGALRLAVVWLPRGRFAFATGLTSASSMVAAMIGDIGMEWIAKNHGWRTIMKIATFVGIIMIPLFIKWVRDNPKIFVNSTKRTSSLHEALSNFLLIFKNSQLFYTGLVSMVLYLSIIVVADVWGPSYIKTAAHIDEVTAIQISTMIYFGKLIGAPINGWFTDLRILSKKAHILFSALAAAGIMSVILIWPMINTFYLKILFFAFGFTCSADIICYAIAHDLTTKAYIATALGWVNCLMMMGGMLVQPMIGFVLDLLWDGQMSPNHIRIYDEKAYLGALCLIPLLIIFGAGISLLIKEKPGKNKLTLQGINPLNQP